MNILSLPLLFNLAASESNTLPTWHWSTASGEVQAEAQFITVEKPREIFLFKESTKDKKHLLTTFDTDANLIFSPDEKWIAMNDFYGSSGSDIHIFHKTAELNFEKMNIDVAEIAWDLLRTKHGVPFPDELFHHYAKVIQWNAKSESVLVSLSGHEDGNRNLSSWLCVVNIHQQTATLDPSEFNKGAVVYKQ